jgi:ABC-type thiamine transport system ATPase subunit
MPYKGKKTKATGSLRKQIKKLVKKLVKEKKLTLALSHYPPWLNHLIGEVILMMANCAYAHPLSYAKFIILQNHASF